MEINIFLWNKIQHFINNQSIISFLESYPPHTLYICGGCIRNFLLDKEDSIKDIDLFVNLPKEDFHLFIKNIQQWGKIGYGQYGSPRLFDFDQNYYFDIVPFYNFIVSNHPITSINELLSNFDFTANAIGLDISTKELFNPENGIEDIKHKVLRAVRLDFPEKNISPQIPLSTVSSFWFRLLHYQYKLQFHFSPETKEWIYNNKFRYKDLNLFKKYFFTPLINPHIIDDIL